MKDYPKFAATDAELVALVAEQRMARVVTIDADGWPRVGLHVFVHDGLTIEAHMVKSDSQLDDMRRTGRALVEIDDVLSSVASDWLDPEDARNADQYYRSVAIQGRAELIDDIEQIATHLRGIVARYQPGSSHTPVETSVPMYADTMKHLVLVRIHPVETSSKFKLGQGASAEKRNQIAEGLVARGRDIDKRTAAVLKRRG